MFRPTDRQSSLLESSWLVPPEKLKRLRRSWAHVFREKVMPLVDEEPFRDAFFDNNGRPNYSIAVLVGLTILKETSDLTDAEVVEQLEFNLQWHYALKLTSDDAHVSERTLRNFRARLLASDRCQRMFESVTAGLARIDSISVSKQRLDSTHIISNIKILTRLGLLCETVAVFLRELEAQLPELSGVLGATFRHRYLEREGYFSDATREQAPRRLKAVAQDMLTLVRRFEHDADVSKLESFHLLMRLFSEQCVEIQRPEPSGPSSGGGGAVSAGGDAEKLAVCAGEVAAAPCAASAIGEELPLTESDASTRPAGGEASIAADDGGAETEPMDLMDSQQFTAVGPALERPTEVIEGAAATSPAACPASAENPAIEGPSQVSADQEALIAQLREPKTISGQTLQSPHDPDATYGHKGKGYLVQLSETCSQENPYQLVTAVDVHGAHQSDQLAVVPMLHRLQQSEMMPKHLLADTGYGSGQNLVAAAGLGVELHAPVQDPHKIKGSDPFFHVPKQPAATPAAPAATEVDNVEQFEVDATDFASLLCGVFGLAAFSFSARYDQVLGCPGGETPRVQSVTPNMLTATFSASACAACPVQAQCPLQELNNGDRQLRRAPATIATELRQVRQQERDFKQIYKMRSGIESTNATLKSRHGLAKPRVRGQGRIRLAAFAKALALNVRRATQYHVRALLAADVEAVGCAA